MQNKKVYNIHIGNEIHKKVRERDMAVKDLMVKFRCSKNTINRMFECTCLKTDLLMKWCVVLEYNFFEVLAKNYIEFNKQNLCSDYFYE